MVRFADMRVLLVVFVMFLLSTTTLGQKQEVYRVGGDVNPPQPIYNPQPPASASDSSSAQKDRKIKLQATAIVWAVIAADGSVSNEHIQVSSGRRDLDKKAEEQVRIWRFNPAMRKGKPVAVYAEIEMHFTLY